MSSDLLPFHFFSLSPVLWGVEHASWSGLEERQRWSRSLRFRSTLEQVAGRCKCPTTLTTQGKCRQCSFRKDAIKNNRNTLHHKGKMALAISTWKAREIKSGQSNEVKRRKTAIWEQWTQVGCTCSSRIDTNRRRRLSEKRSYMID